VAVGCGHPFCGLPGAAVGRRVAAVSVHAAAGRFRRLPAGLAGARADASTCGVADDRIGRVSRRRRADFRPRPAALRVRKPLQHVRVGGGKATAENAESQRKENSATSARSAVDCLSRVRIVYRMLTARAASSASTASEITAWTIVRIFAQRERTAVSVGEKAVLVLKARNR